MWFQTFWSPGNESAMRFGDFFLGALSITGAYTTSSKTPTITTLNGTYAGAYNGNYGVESFLGIPFAQPPIGSLRFRTPQPLNTSWTGTKDATEYGNQCVGYGSDTYLTPFPLSEDCLTLNVVRPAGRGVTEKLPVAVWIHGGGYVQGSSQNPRYNLSFIVQHSVETEHPFIGVSINYRLQSWGFLFSREIKDQKVGNLGLRDQRAALNWVQENIASFGGDPSKVTIWGESAGAGSVGAQLIAYGGRDDGLFRAAIAQSGSSLSFSRYPSSSDYQAVYDNITATTGCSSASDTLDCLRAVPFEALNNGFNSSAVLATIQGPTIDEDFIIQSPTTQLLNGQFVKVPLLIGTNTDEGTSFGPIGIDTDAEFRSYLTGRLTTNNSTLSALQVLYPDIPEIGTPETFKARPGPDLGLQYKRSSAIIGDSLMHAPRRFMNQIWAKNNLSSYSYRFNVVPNGVSYSSGSNHFKEVAFVFDNVDGVGYAELAGTDPFANKSASYKDLAGLMAGMWGSFITTLDPNIDRGPQLSWPVYGNYSGQNYVFDANVTNLAYVEEDTFRAEAINYFTRNFVELFGR
ncbi:related to triacylglycerol lipase V precursor [Phialocephala subalpina]|uniref:Carboxylic ester hydrolase n=1 Tax=Phialocephala subalpina TaxID=576137 RepID=A0A1L7XSD4_9HELO|nr:related to triacylglycerol lipase V precursor [Phialocephala subalpina]